MTPYQLLGLCYAYDESLKNNIARSLARSLARRELIVRNGKQ
jgi:hypothetical protein